MAKKKKFVRVNVQENGRLGGLARAAKLSPAKRKAAARKAVNVRWAKYRDGKAPQPWESDDEERKVDAS